MPEQETVTGCVYKDWVCCPKCQHIYFTSVDTVVDWRMTHIPIDFFARVGNCPNCGNTGLDSEKDSCRPIGRHSALRFRGKVHLPKGLSRITTEVEGELVKAGDLINGGPSFVLPPPTGEPVPTALEKRWYREWVYICKLLVEDGRFPGTEIAIRKAIAAYTDRYGEEG